MKHRSITTILSAIAFLCIIAIPAIASASNFSCNTSPVTNVSGSNYNAVLTINQLGSTVTLSQANIDVAPAATAGSTLTVPSGSQQGSSAMQNIYTFNNLLPSTAYVAYAIYPSNGQQSSEIVANCNFTTANGTTGAGATPAQAAATAASANTTCSPSNITNDSCYEQNCTGQSSEDSQSCGSYATAYAIKDDNGDTTCASITSANDTSCCDNDVDSPMCIAYQNYTAADAQSQSGVIPSTLTTTGSIVSPDGDGLVPCDGNDCTVNSVIQLLDNLMSFFFQTLLLPIFVVMVMYLGYSYLTANGKPGQHAKVISMAQHMVGGLVLMLCAWLIVHTILSILGYTDTLGFFGS
jgi:hypothetical protein